MELNRRLAGSKILTDKIFKKGDDIRFKKAFDNIHPIWILSNKCKIDINKKMIILYINLNSILLTLPKCLDFIAKQDSVWLRIEKSLKTKMEDYPYWEYDALALKPYFWIETKSDKWLLDEDLVKLLLNNHEVTESNIESNQDGFYGVYCQAIEIAWKRFQKYPKDISRLFYNRRGWNVVAKGDGIFKLTREEYSWIIEEVYIDLNKESYTKFKGKTIDPNIKQEVDYELETFGWKSLYDKFQLPLAWTFGGEQVTHYRQYTYRRWASEIFQLCLIQSWLYISEHSSAYYSDHLFDR